MSEIFILDDQHPEDLAMLQALYSRSPASVVTHLEKLKASGSGKFMDQYYVGYGHASIGDCGVTTVFIEQVSILAAKAIQDTPLYNGQEASTRYLDFSKQAALDPYENPESARIQSRWMGLYHHTLPLLIEGLKQRYPFDPSIYKSEKIWANALSARAFDIARSLLPLGTTTLLSWTTSLRAARDHLRRLKHHPLPEIRTVAKKIFDSLQARYPNSFKVQDMEIDSSARETYLADHAVENNFVSADSLLRRFSLTPEDIVHLTEEKIIARTDALDLKGLRDNESDLLALRPAFTPLPWRLESYGRYNFLFLLDFGSFRDLQRHRNGVCQIPLIDGRYGFHPWYLNQFNDLLPVTEAKQLNADISAQFSALADLSGKMGPTTTPFLNQYLFPMGTQVLVHASYSLPETVYIGELRSGKTVHPSLRPVAQKMLDILRQDLPSIALHGDTEEDSWSAKRGEQTISDKTS
ncbi:MAG: FAD-dependent thymidylate synthase [Alphaproteobacteria bacterium]|nr:FAD-dependent thymidylate synthase [Alphaproteobacteria bacterium]